MASTTTIITSDGPVEQTVLEAVPDESEPKPRGLSQCRATQITPAWNRLIPGEPVSLDIEFQNYKRPGWMKFSHRVGRVAIVNTKGETVLDVYAAYPREEGTIKLMPPAKFLVSHQDLRFENGAVPAHKVERWVKQILKDRTVIVHGGKHDLTAFVIETDVYASSKVVDTQREYSYLQGDGTPGLKTVAAVVLGESVQEVVHSPVEDAQTALKLWQRKYTYDRDAEVARLETERTWSRNNGASGGRRGHRQSHRGRARGGGDVAGAPPNSGAPATTSLPARPPAIADANEFPPLGQA